MMSKKVQSLRWFWDQESDALIAKIRENSDEEMYSHYSIEWKGNPDKWVAFFEGVEIGTSQVPLYDPIIKSNVSGEITKVCRVASAFNRNVLNDVGIIKPSRVSTSKYTP